MPQEKTNDAAESRLAECQLPEWHNAPVEDLTIRQCLDLSVVMVDRYMWITNDQNHLWYAAMLAYVAQEARKRCEEGEQFCKALKIGDASKRGNRFAFIDENIYGMVGHFSTDTAGRATLQRLVKQTGLDDWDTGYGRPR